MKLNRKVIPQEERSFLDGFIAQFQWIFAKDIRNYGFLAMYYTIEGYYLELGDCYYWTMDDNPEDTDLINRAFLDDYELVENSWYWKGRRNRTV